MENESLRITDSASYPDVAAVKKIMGKEAFKFWEFLTDFIAKRYPGVFLPEWIYGGKKHGWTLRYKKNKSFCTFVPEKDCFKTVIVFGADERKKAERIRDSLSDFTLQQYDSAKTYRDGKWLLLTVDSEQILKDIEILLEVKRKIKM